MHEMIAGKSGILWYGKGVNVCVVCVSFMWYAYVLFVYTRAYVVVQYLGYLGLVVFRTHTWTHIPAYTGATHIKDVRLS